MYIDRLTNFSLNGEIFIPENQEETAVWIKFLMENVISCVDDNIREEVTLRLIEAQSIPGKHDWDGKKGKLMIEVKNETQAIANGKYNGSGLFNHLSWKSFEKYKKKGIYLQGGYTREGRLEYCVAFDIKHLLPKMESALMEADPTKSVKGVNVDVSVTVADYPSEVEVIYISKSLDFTAYSGKLYKILTDNWTGNTMLRSSRLANKELSIKSRLPNT